MMCILKDMVQGRPEDSQAPIQLLIAGPLWAEYADAMFSRFAFL